MSQTAIDATVFFSVVITACVCLGLAATKSEEITKWVKAKFKKHKKEVNLDGWMRSDVKLGMEFASNGVVIKAFVGAIHAGEMYTTKTRIATDASEIGSEVMALLAEIKLGK
jgi:hypothetical protein